MNAVTSEDLNRPRDSFRQLRAITRPDDQGLTVVDRLLKRPSGKVAAIAVDLEMNSEFGDTSLPPSLPPSLPASLPASRSDGVRRGRVKDSPISATLNSLIAKRQSHGQR